MFDIIRPLIWDDEKIPVWYRQNTTVFTRDTRLIDEPLMNGYVMMPVTDVIHPELYEANLAFKQRPIIKGLLHMKEIIKNR